MKLGLIGDVHAEDERLERALAHFRAAKVDSISCMGDLASASTSRISDQNGQIVGSSVRHGCIWPVSQALR
jgi:predicted phosphodiesterase